MRIEQVRRPVQRNRGLACAGPSLYDEDAARLGPDDAVLLDLNRLDDVAHPAGAPGRQRGEQRAFPAEGGLVVLGQCLEVEHVVLDVEQPPSTGTQVTSAYDAQRIGRGGPVERLGYRRPPVDQQRVVALVGQPDPADVVPVAAEHVQTAEAQAGLDGVELRQPVLVHRREGVALAAVLRRAAGAAAADLGQALPGLVAQVVQPRVEPGQVLLFPVDLTGFAADQRGAPFASFGAIHPTPPASTPPKLANVIDFARDVADCPIRGPLLITFAKAAGYCKTDVRFGTVRCGRGSGTKEMLCPR